MIQIDRPDFAVRGRISSFKLSPSPTSVNYQKTPYTSLVLNSQIDALYQI